MVMENASNKERRCIERSLQARLAAAKTRLAELNKDRIPFDHPLRGITGGITWNKTIVGKIKQIALLPLVLLFVLIAYASTPILYILTLWELLQKRHELKMNIKALEAESLSDDVPDEKTLGSLWWLHGLEDRDYSCDERVSLLDTWISVLYGEDAATNLRLQSRVAKIAEQNYKVNLPYAQGKEGAAHFILASPVDTLLRQLSEELPLYE
jgi:hypothetical protein